MTNELRRRRGGPTVQIVADVIQNARANRGWVALLVLILTVVAAAAAFVGQTVLPWAIYPAL